MDHQKFLDNLSDYPHMSDMLKIYSCQEILDTVAAMINVSPSLLMECSMEEVYTGCYLSALQDLQENILHYDWLYSQLKEEASRMTFANLIGHRLLPTQSFLDAAGNAKPPQIQKDASSDHTIQKVMTYCSQYSNHNFMPLNENSPSISFLLEAKRHIQHDFPKIIISASHTANDLWKIPRLLEMIHPSYGFLIRYCNYSTNKEIFIYAIPPEKKTSDLTNKYPKRIAAIASVDGWENSQLLKDCGLIPYLLYKNHHCNVSMVGCQKGVYPNLKYVKGLKMEFLPDGQLQSKADYLIKESKNIDCLILYGCYSTYFPLVFLYKQHNPHGKVFLALDANPRWMDSIHWTEPTFQKFMDQCDVIAASNLIIQKHLNEKWPWLIEYVPNGFYHFTSGDWNPDFNKKKNIILTVSRLGTPEKATNILLESFAAIADQIPDWNLHLAGPIAEEFEDYILRFWENFPNLKNRILFLGNITDREILYKEYLDAKIFALPSTREGSPNVFAEALFSGNALAITKIDMYQEAIDFGRCGMTSEINDVEGFSDILLHMCQNENLSIMCEHAYQYARKHYDMEKIVARLYYMIFGEQNYEHKT